MTIRQPFYNHPDQVSVEASWLLEPGETGAPFAVPLSPAGDITLSAFGDSGPTQPGDQFSFDVQGAFVQPRLDYGSASRVVKAVLVWKQRQ